jgi:hypothetical protein
MVKQQATNEAKFKKLLSLQTEQRAIDKESQPIEKMKYRLRIFQ